MTDQEQKFIQLAQQRDNLLKQLKEVSESLEPLMQELGEGKMVQAENGTVYKVQKWIGQFVTPKTLEYKRTRNTEAGDPKTGGSFLSKKEATENGFVI